MDVLIDVDTLAARLEAKEPTVVLDVRWKLGDAHGRRHHLDAHIPGAVYVDLDTELAAPASPEAGRHPLPSARDLEAAARRWGIDAGDAVVAYDDVGGTSAARVWWLLRWAGLDDVYLLDGGLESWRRSGRELHTGPVDVEPGGVVLGAGAMPVVDADGASSLAGHGVLLDARAAERFRGEVEPVDPRAGHIPGAVSAPTTDNLTDDGTFRRPDELRRLFSGVGVRPGAPVGVYCGSGVNAAHEIAALAIAGIDAALYPGSWSQWSADPDRPVATGAEPPRQS